jgi:hypothetical protein
MGPNLTERRFLAFAANSPMGEKSPRCAYQIRFGRFLGFAANGPIGPNLTEWRFLAFAANVTVVTNLAER